MRYKCILAYDGFDYVGFQIQNEKPTIELELNKALFKFLQQEIKIYAAGRTDTHVHAKGQVFHFDFDREYPCYGLKKGLNDLLPKSIYIRDITIVADDFHSRFNATSKEYRYYINFKEFDPLTFRYMPYIPNLNVAAMEEAMQLLIGTHDFKGFASTMHPDKDTVRTIFDIKLNIYNDKLEFVFYGNGFLKYQIRRMMGLLIEIGKQKDSKETIIKVLEMKDSSISHKVADGCGLYLYQVNYE